ncbi:hypothetical protein HWV07_15640 [Natronomonas salina]|uniref:hypothetical protein n=1 Tax=Natronomonas salina TaxID=1710540 RepID=UPI0015B6C7F2|nr:hypothetical protein [Natronomonas salina]QLD90389.1 hypothetical protein HWV07_15640 [Natronomonas salina]
MEAILMPRITRRDVLSTVGAATLLAGCSESSSTSSGGFTKTTVENQQLIAEFESSLEAETISVIDPAGESFAETSVATGASRVTFDIPMPYAPGEYRLVAAAGDETLAETTQAIRPELEIVDVGVGANRLDEMPEGLHFPDRQVYVTVKNEGTGPDGITRLEFSKEFPNSNTEREGSGIFDGNSGVEENEQKVVPKDEATTLISWTLPFADYESNCDSDSHLIDAEIRVQPIISKRELEEAVEIRYSPSGSQNACNVSLER